MNYQMIVSNPKGLNVQWAQQIVNLHALNANVNAVELLSVDLGTTTRVRLAIDHTGPSHLPKQWFVKLPPKALRAKIITALPRLLPTEVRFYNNVAASIPLQRPTTLAAHSVLGLGSTLVLNDVTEVGATPGKPSDTLTARQAELVVEQLALLHASFWGTADKDPRYCWLNNRVRQLEDALGTLLAEPLMRQGIAKAGSLVPPLVRQEALRYARFRKKAMHFLSQSTKTLIHHDCHPGNLFWQHAQPGFLDWQLVRIGEGLSDVAYFLATALDPNDRRAHEMSLVAHYHRTLCEHGIIDLDRHSLIDRYRAHLIYPFEAMIDTLAIGGLMPLESNLELIRRSATAIADLDAFAALSAIY